MNVQTEVNTQRTLTNQERRAVIAWMRSVSGHGMMECRYALSHEHDDVFRALAFLRINGLAVYIRPKHNETAWEARERWERTGVEAGAKVNRELYGQVVQQLLDAVPEA